MNWSNKEYAPCALNGQENMGYRQAHVRQPFITMAFREAHGFPQDEHASEFLLDTESWQSLRTEPSHNEKQILRDPESQTVYCTGSSAGPFPDSSAMTGSLRLSGTYTPFHGSHHSRETSALLPPVTIQNSSALDLHIDRSLPKAWSTVGEMPNDYGWIPEYDLQPDWTGATTHRQAERILEDIMETGAIFHPRIWKCHACDKEFQKKHALNKHLRCHIKHHVCPTLGCDFQAYLKKDVRRHINTVHGAVKIPCPVKGCEYSKTGPKRGVSRKDALKRHMESHKTTDQAL